MNFLNFLYFFVSQKYIDIEFANQAVALAQFAAKDETNADLFAQLMDDSDVNKEKRDMKCDK